jgi:hypothetical protein
VRITTLGLQAVFLVAPALFALRYSFIAFRGGFESEDYPTKQETQKGLGLNNQQVMSSFETFPQGHLDQTCQVFKTWQVSDTDRTHDTEREDIA